MLNGNQRETNIEMGFRLQGRNRKNLRSSLGNGMSTMTSSGVSNLQFSSLSVQSPILNARVSVSRGLDVRFTSFRFSQILILRSGDAHMKGCLREVEIMQNPGLQKLC